MALLLPHGQAQERFRVKALPLPPREVVLDRLNYDPLTGIFIWKNPLYPRFRGAIAGKADPKTRYRRIGITGYGLFVAHRLAWLYVHGEYDHTKFCIDHIDGDRGNNAITNLRLATFSQNTINCKTRTNTKTGVKGVTITSLGKYRVVIRPHGPGSKKIELGCYSTLEEAAKVRAEASQAHFGEFSREDDAHKIIPLRRPAKNDEIRASGPHANEGRSMEGLRSIRQSG